MPSRAAPDTSRIGIGGWTYPPWRGTFFPPALPHKQELAHASRRLCAIEANGTYYPLGPASRFINGAKERAPAAALELMRAVV